MKIGKPIILLFKATSEHGNKKRHKYFPPHEDYEEKNDIPYKEGGDFYNCFDLIYAKGEKRNCCVIDIHGGAYIFGNRKENFFFGTRFSEAGFDFIAIDYHPNNGDIGTKDQINECAECLNYIFAHKKELGLENDCFVLTGDSAGGHFALLLAEAVTNPEVAGKLGYSFENPDVRAVLINCPVYDFEYVGSHGMTHKANVRTFGKNYKDSGYMSLISPRTYIHSLTIPLFVSTCEKDFLRGQSLLIKEDKREKEEQFMFMDITSKDKQISHVHNVILPDKTESKQVNEAMFDFIAKAII